MSYFRGLKMVANASLLYFVGGLVVLCGRSTGSAVGGVSVVGGVWLVVAVCWSMSGAVIVWFVGTFFVSTKCGLVVVVWLSV